MTGTLINTATIVAGSLIGALLKRGIKEEYSTINMLPSLVIPAIYFLVRSIIA